MKKLLFALVVLFATNYAFAQKMRYCTYDQLQYDSEKKRTILRSNSELFTGYEYAMQYYGRDTSLLRFYRDGRLEWEKTFGYNQRLTQHTRYYFHGLKNDSICMEQLSYSEESGDTTGYFVQYVNKKRTAKYQKQYAYYYSYDGQPKGLWYTTTSQFFHKKDTNNFPAYNYPETSYDSLGFYANNAMTGTYTEYHENGKVKAKGVYNTYEYCLAHQGNYPSYPATGRVGTWMYYNANGVLEREEFFDATGALTVTVAYFPNGKIQSKYGYKKRFSEFVLPVRDGLGVGWYDTCYNVSTVWYENGKLASETFSTRNGNTITCSWQENGQPLLFQARSNTYKPVGIEKRWDGKGNVTHFVNYSVEYIDTLCYIAQEGKIQSLNMRDRTVSMDWQNLPLYYYGVQQTYVHLNKLTAVHKEFYGNGAVKMEIHLRNGKRNGAYTEWDSSGVQLVKGTFVNDLADGAWFEWYANGRPKKMLNYRAGIRDGIYEEYYASGALKWRNNYVNGLPGSGEAYSENGTAIRHASYLDAFYPLSCLRAQQRAFSGPALHYYLLDTAVNRSWVTIPDSVVADYAVKIVAGYQSVVPAYDFCAPVAANGETNSFDAFHSCFAISASAYTESSKKIMRVFFARHGIKLDSSVVAKTPQLGLEKEFIVYYSSSKNMLNKALIVDSLETYLTPNSGDGKNGYIIPLDANQPAASFPDFSGNSTLTTQNGYSILTLESYANDPVTYVRVKSNKKYIIYDDYTSDYFGTETTADQLRYWPLTN